jgi:hypothetical protein
MLILKYDFLKKTSLALHFASHAGEIVFKAISVRTLFLYHQRPVRLAYQPPSSSTFLSEQISHQQPANNAFPSQQISISHQPPAKRTGCKVSISVV